jgi:hypothetical protein
VPSSAIRLGSSVASPDSRYSPVIRGGAGCAASDTAAAAGRAADEAHDTGRGKAVSVARSNS